MATPQHSSVTSNDTAAPAMASPEGYTQAEITALAGEGVTEMIPQLVRSGELHRWKRVNASGRPYWCYDREDVHHLMEQRRIPDDHYSSYEAWKVLGVSGKPFARLMAKYAIPKRKIPWRHEFAYPKAAIDRLANDLAEMAASGKKRRLVSAMVASRFTPEASPREGYTQEAFTNLLGEGATFAIPELVQSGLLHRRKAWDAAHGSRWFWLYDVEDVQRLVVQRRIPADHYSWQEVLAVIPAKEHMVAELLAEHQIPHVKLPWRHGYYYPKAAVDVLAEHLAQFPLPPPRVYDTYPVADNERFAHFYTMLYPEMFGWTVRALNGDESTAEDVVQDMFAKFWEIGGKYIERFTDEEEMRKVFWGAMRNALGAHLDTKYAKIRDVRRQCSYETLGRAMAARDPSVERQVVARERWTELLQRLKAYPPVVQYLAMLKAQGYTYAEMNAHMAERALSLVEQKTWMERLRNDMADLREAM